MFYYLLYNSSFSFIINNRLFTTILYGSILYILTHAILNYCNIEILNIINNYFWIIFTLDIISLSYGIYQTFTKPLQTNSNTENNLNVSFNLLKNKINTLLDRKNDLTITQTELNNTTQYPKQYPHNTNHTSHTSHTNGNIVMPNQVVSENKFSTPISHIKKHNKKNTDNSTPINLIRNQNMQDVPEPIINEEIYSDNISNNLSNNIGDNIGNNIDNNISDNVAESIAGSDIGSVMDLDDFEKSL
jgi:hypothetical protein